MSSTKCKLLILEFILYLDLHSNGRMRLKTYNYFSSFTSRQSALFVRHLRDIKTIFQRWNSFQHYLLSLWLILCLFNLIFLSSTRNDANSLSSCKYIKSIIYCTLKYWAFPFQLVAIICH